MECKEYYAHIAEDGRRQTVKEHLIRTAELAKKFAAVFGQEEMGRLEGLTHDIGKYSTEFQNRILNHGNKVDHSTAGAKECIAMGAPELAFCVAGHHSGIPDRGGQTDTQEDSTLMGRWKRNTIPDYSPWKEIKGELSCRPSRPTWLRQVSDQDFYTRMLYSCLTDADFLDTEAFMSNGTMERGGGEPINVLTEKLDEYTKCWYPPKTELNLERCKILDRCVATGDSSEKNGLYTLTVPTGGGKTVASLAFALHHARKLDLERVVYVIPYTSIIEQTADQFRKILGENNVLEHHSGVEVNVNEEMDAEGMKLIKSMENWDIPVVVTTAVQFFESIYSNRSSKCRKLHHLAKSVIIFDEAQMLPLLYLKPCLSAIYQLTSHYGASAVLCTATQPSLSSIFREFDTKIRIQEICTAGTYRPEVFRRVIFQKEDELSWIEVAERMREQDQVLCIVNTRKSAEQLYSLLEGDGNYHLSTLMTPNHRRQKLEEIRKRLKAGQSCRVVSTSLIEAGVDVDFPAVFRELAGLDSILQAAGRCNREGKRSAEESIVTVFRSETPVPPLFRLNRDIGQMTIKKQKDISSPEAIRYYFDGVMALNKLSQNAFDQKQIMGLMQQFAFARIAESFHLIEQNTITVYIPIGEGAESVRRLEMGERSRKLFRKLNQSAVNLYDGHFKALEQTGQIYSISSVKGENHWVLGDLSLYSEETGLSLKADEGRALFI